MKPASTLLLLLGTAAVLSAARPERVLVDSFEDFAKGEAESTVVVQPGRLKPAARLMPGPEIPGMSIFCGVKDVKGDAVLVGTGPEGRVYRVSGLGRVEQVSKFGEPYVYAMARGPDGTVYAATSPGGKVFRLNRQGRFEEYFDPGETYIWALAVDDGGRVFAATGTRGRIYRITGKGQGGVWYDSDETSIRSLAFDGEGNLLAGSSGQGLVYRITGKGEAVVLLDSSKEEIVALSTLPDGQVFVAALGGQTSLPEVPESPDASAGKLAETRGLVTVEGGEEGQKASGKTEEKGESSSKPASRGGSLLYIIRRNNYPELLWKTDEDILSLQADGDRVRIGTGNEGNLYTMAADGTLELNGHVDAWQVTAIVGDRGHPCAVLTNGMARLFRYTGGDANPGIYRSDVIDSRLFARWGRLQVHGQGRWWVRTRSGNTPDPDKSWNGWMRLDGGKVASPAARYLQFEVSLAEGEIDRVEIYYLPQNQAPRIIVLRVLGPGIGYEGIGQPDPPPQPATADQMLKTELIEKNFPMRYQPVMKQGLRTIAWSAIDPNNDPLRYRLEIRADNDSGWEELADKLEESVFSWDTSGWPDGTYLVRVTADDSPDNVEGQELTDSRVSEPWEIDNTPPEIKVLDKGASSVRFRVTDQGGGVLLAVGCSTDGREFHLLQPEDGILDSSTETFEAPRTKGKPLYIRAEDESGNSAGLRVTWPQ